MSGGAAEGRASRRTFLLSGILAAVAALLAVVASRSPILDVSLPRWALLVGLAGAFLLGEQLMMHIEFRQQAHSLTLAGVPLAIAVLTMPLPDVVIARFVGAAIALVLQRIELKKIVYNCSAYAFEAAIDTVAVSLILGPQPSLGVTDALIVMAVIAVCDQLMSLLVMYVIWLHGGPVSRTDFREVLPTAIVLSIAATSVAFGVLLLGKFGALGIGLIVLFMVISTLLYRGYVATTRRHHRLELLHEFVNGGAGAQSLSEVASELLTRIRLLLRAGSVQLILVPDELTPEDAAARPDHGAGARIRAVVRAARFSDDDEHGVSVDEVDVALDWATVRALDEAEPLLAPRSTKDRAIRRWLQDHEYLDAILVPLPATNGFIGTLTVADRLGETATFTGDDLTLLQTLAGHLAIAGGNARLVERLGYDATHDALTGLSNRTHLARQIDQLEPGSSACVLLLDLDRFKEVNDAWGHQSGDRLLRIIAKRLCDFLPASATVARLGGDEFAALVPDFTGGEAGAREWGQRLAAMLSRPVTFPEAILSPEASIGIAVSGPESTSNDLLRQADTAMYVSKSESTSVAVYHPNMDQGRVENLALLADLRTALREHPEQIEVYYQPQVDLQTRAVVSAEALVRWNHPTLGLLSPDRFIPLAESTGLINEFTPVIMQAALGECRRWQDRGRPISVAVNLSARNIGDPTLPDRIRRALAYAGVPPSSLIVEITESCIIDDPEETTHVLERFADLGISISLDDFGTGYSSLSYLQRLPVREVKIDRSFISGLSSPDPRSSRALIGGIAGLGANLGLRVVAEGVETAEAMEEVQRLGCHIAQGFHISRPVPGPQFRAWLEENVTAANADGTGTIAVPLRLISGS